ncbi:MAG: DUF4351 domain-containing protein [Nostocales cyanobacterium 94392]|nr:DUF4351 domain-containing protein [Nostocales cyanobacterium 94392]
MLQTRVRNVGFTANPAKFPWRTTRNITIKYRVRELSIEQLENLGEALLDFTSLDELEAWLKQQE